jgi:uncharacterized UBP type Zn finger protein
MGFPVEKCRKALIETKNVSLEIALDHFFTMADDDTKKKPTSTSKGTWSCSVCTLENPSANTECEACSTPAPEQVMPIVKLEEPLEIINEADEAD